MYDKSFSRAKVDIKLVKSKRNDNKGEIILKNMDSSGELDPFFSSKILPSSPALNLITY
jgi:hypothetical protein